MLLQKPQLLGRDLIFLEAILRSVEGAHVADEGLVDLGRSFDRASFVARSKLGHIYFPCGSNFHLIRRPRNGMPSDRIDTLVRAFKAVWDHYFQPGRDSGVLECLARPALAEFLVEKSRQGIDDEPSLAAAGLQFLFSLEDDFQEEPIDVALGYPPANSVDESDVRWNVHLENASAQFLPVGHFHWHSVK